MRTLRRQGIAFVAIDLEPPFGSIDRYAAGIDSAIAQVEAATNQAPVVVAHSMGGLAVRAWMAAGNRGDRVHRVVTVASPHHGSWLARVTHTANGAEMCLGSPWLKALSARESDTTYRRFICFYGRCDNVVFPTSSATLPGADNRHLPQTAHMQMVYHHAVMSEVLSLVAPVRAQLT